MNMNKKKKEELSYEHNNEENEGNNEENIQENNKGIKFKNISFDLSGSQKQIREFIKKIDKLQENTNVIPRPKIINRKNINISNIPTPNSPIRSTTIKESNLEETNIAYQEKDEIKKKIDSINKEIKNLLTMISKSDSYTSVKLTNEISKLLKNKKRILNIYYKTTF